MVAMQVIHMSAADGREAPGPALTAISRKPTPQRPLPTLSCFLHASLARNAIHGTRVRPHHAWCLPTTVPLSRSSGSSKKLRWSTANLAGSVRLGANNNGDS